LKQNKKIIFLKFAQKRSATKWATPKRAAQKWSYLLLKLWSSQLAITSPSIGFAKKGKMCFQQPYTRVSNDV